MNESTEHAPEEDLHGPDPGAVPEAGFFGRIIDKGGVIFALMIVAAMFMLIWEVFARYVLNSPTAWVHETVVFLCGLAFIYGGLYAVARDSHIRVVLIYDVIPKGARRVLDIVISLVCAFTSVMFGWAAWGMATKATFAPSGEMRFETSGSAWNPPYPAYVKIFLCAAMVALTIQFLILAFNYLRGGQR
ncbi:TRAP transporter small permease subunit [Paracoccaceae bacterium GXU_MW_L88]